MNSESPIDPADPRWLLSALADGEAEAAAVERSCAAWADANAAACQSWHVYHLIGDVLRSDDLAVAPARDRAFLERLRLRLDDEPAILAPQQPAASVAAPTAPVRSRRGWALPMAMAAGVMALATGLVLTLGSGDAAAPASQLAQSSPPPLAQTPAGATLAVAAPAVQGLATPELAPQGSRVLRDAQLDRYLRAHREYGAALPGSLPGGAGRGITAVSFDR
jgi:sigma-E factor negative regulatory protein RseA